MDGCSIHKTILECYCLDGIPYLCGYCIAKIQGGFQVWSIGDASVKKKELLSNVLKELSASKSETENRIRSLKTPTEKIQYKADGLSKKFIVVFQKMRKHIEDLETKVLSEIARQVEEAVAIYRDEIRELETKRDELSRKMAAIEDLYTLTDPVTGLQRPGDYGHGNNQRSAGDCSTAACDLDEGSISEVLHTGIAELVVIARSGLFMVEKSDILLDEDTAGNNLEVEDDKKSFYWVNRYQSTPKTPQRFKDHQVLSTTSFSTGRHFWMVETSKCGNWRFGMSYASMTRKGFRSYIGCNDKSWGLCKWNNQYSAMHACKETLLPDKLTCQRFGVYLDYEAGELSFYELCDPIRHLHTFSATFTEPLHAIFRLWLDSYGGAWMTLKSME
ncbi:tripartite motif-containing protein 14-like [Dendropsophus ebraccatus]|uniref:tripartite motif-containing protein 14-like n=1 Tax=Dendropsophus ebraccatus TaxID=150705 RepID=UPI00383115B5